ncbi:coiled-coil domain-containing protein 158-like isoform X3 [Salarias fasciatus]|uniref:coiled-coil domain-containing protein 158-like isoform X3 n=1 Tax=Salarias fasciatus TaxID=181472 RepID=UPI001176BE24|nr:coiled-coil domain-containing protein 158 isoform X3 [Salarias fasciatus]
MNLHQHNDMSSADHSPKEDSLTQTAASLCLETRDSSSRLRLTSLTLEELSEELDRRTKEIQRLQEEVENVTKVALQRIGCTSDSPPGQSSLGHGVLPSFQQREMRPLVFVDNLNQESCQRDISCPSMQAIENAIDGCLQQLSDLRLNKTQNQHEQETSNPQEAVVNLQVQIHNVRREKDFLSDLRLNESKKHVDQMEKMLRIVEELQSIQRSAEQTVQKAENESMDLNNKAGALEETVKDHTLRATRNGHSHIICAENANNTKLKLQSVATDQNGDFNSGTGNVCEQFLLSEEQPTIDEYNTETRMQDLIAHIGHEVATLADKLSSSNDCGVSLRNKLELLKKLAERQTLLHECHIGELESNISLYREKVCCGENQLFEVHTQLRNVQRENSQLQREAKELQSELHRHQSCCEGQQGERWEEVKVLKGQLESTREQLHKAEEERSSLQALLERRAQEGSRSRELLRDKDEELRLRQQETQQCLARLEELQSQFQTLLAEQETLTLKLKDKEQVIAVLNLHMEGSSQMTGQHKRTIEGLNQENSLLSNQLNQCKLEIQHLRAELDRHKADVAAAPLEKRELQASLAEQSRRAREQRLKEQQLRTRLELPYVQLHAASRLREAQDMQKEVKARREQVDLMQSRIQHLEEKEMKLRQEKREQSLEARRRLQQLSLAREERKQLTLELEALRSKDQQMSESFVNCEDFIQLREQEFYRLKLQHALYLKELQGPNLHTAPKDSPTSSGLPSPPASEHAAASHIGCKRQQESSTHKPWSPVKGVRGVVISENCGPHTGSGGGGSSRRRRSAPGRALRTTFTEEAEEAGSGSRLRRKTCGSEPRFLRTAEPSKKAIHTSFIQSRAASSSAVKSTSYQFLCPGRKSPVHALLTSDPTS